MSESEWARLLNLLRDRPDSGEALELALTTLRTAPVDDEIVEQLAELAGTGERAGQHLLLSEALHSRGRHKEAAVSLRSARKLAGPGGLDDLWRQFPPRYTERLRFYACGRLYGIEGQRVLEIGGMLPRGFVQAAAPASWTCVDLLIEEETEEGFYRQLPGDAAQLPLVDESVDRVFSSSAFEHISNLGAALAEMARVLDRKSVV